MKKIISIFCVILLIIACFSGCNSLNKNGESKSKELVIYSGRKEPLFLPVVKKFENAKLFIDFLLEKDTQKLFAELNYEIPVIEGVEVKGVKPLSEIKTMDVKLEELGKELDNTINFIEKLKLS